MRLRYDLYVLFSSPRDEEPADVARDIAFNDIGKAAIQGISNSSLYENGYVLTGTLYLNPRELFPKRDIVYEKDINGDTIKEVKRRLKKYEDVELQRVESGIPIK